MFLQNSLGHPIDRAPGGPKSVAEYIAVHGTLRGMGCAFRSQQGHPSHPAQRSTLRFDQPSGPEYREKSGETRLVLMGVVVGEGRRLTCSSKKGPGAAVMDRLACG